ncbi:hypothetical protein FPQ18DRAFT_339675 [Pyronema domesticum]|nr:hypothetical protein FPQ18DRAFT_339675 [Pyronema domesticum]
MGVVERIKWPFKKDEYRNTVEKLQRFVKTFAFALKIENFEILSKSTETVLTTLEENRKQLQSVFLLQAQMKISMDEAINESMNKQMTLLGGIIKAVSSSANDQEMILSAVQDIKQTLVGSATAQEIKELVEWLSPLEPQMIHQDVRKMRVANTGNWFLELEAFEKWRDGDGSEPGTNTFSCYAIPGAGKQS